MKTLTTAGLSFLTEFTDIVLYDNERQSVVIKVSLAYEQHICDRMDEKEYVVMFRYNYKTTNNVLLVFTK